MKRVIFTLVIVNTFSVASCQSGETADTDPRAQLTAQIDSLEGVLRNADGDLNPELAQAMVAKYERFATTFPEDSMTMKYWYRAGEVARNIPGNELYAITYYSNIHQTDPGNPLADEAVFMTGVCFDQVGDKERAFKTFSYFLEQYPDHEWSEEARELLILNTDTNDLEGRVGEWLEQAQEQPQK